MQVLHANAPGYAYTGFTGTAKSIREMYENCKTITHTSEIQQGFTALINMITSVKGYAKKK
jgi:hypothetical protein